MKPVFSLIVLSLLLGVLAEFSALPASAFAEVVLEAEDSPAVFENTARRRDQARWSPVLTSGSGLVGVSRDSPPASVCVPSLGAPGVLENGVALWLDTTSAAAVVPAYTGHTPPVDQSGVPDPFPPPKASAAGASVSAPLVSIPPRSSILLGLHRSCGPLTALPSPGAPELVRLLVPRPCRLGVWGPRVWVPRGSLLSVPA